MERGPLISILEAMIGTPQTLKVMFTGDSDPMEIQNVMEIEPLMSSQGLKITTNQNQIWLDARHVCAVWQAKTD